MTTIQGVTSQLLRTMPLPEPKEGSKDHRGCALVVAGSPEVPGAALLAGTSALRAGAGKLQIATARTIALHLGLAVPEAMVVGLAESADGGLDHRAATERLLPMMKKCDAILIGPGMVEHEPTTLLTLALVAAFTSGALVLDAAAVCDLRQHADAVRACQGHVVITPHAGEMAQLLERKREQVEADPLDAARTAARLLGAVVVMKGAKTHIVGPGGEEWCYEGWSGDLGLR